MWELFGLWIRLGLLIFLMNPTKDTMLAKLFLDRMLVSDFLFVSFVHLSI